jgi:hypothetical protein
MRSTVTLVTFALVVVSCAVEPAPKSAIGTQQARSSESESKPVGTQLFRDADASEKEFEIGENQGQGGLGKYSLRLDGKFIWPPEGGGCNKLVRCCTELSSTDQLALACLLALGRDGTCTAALGTVKAIAGEQGVSVPASCAD